MFDQENWSLAAVILCEVEAQHVRYHLKLSSDQYNSRQPDQGFSSTDIFIGSC